MQRVDISNFDWQLKHVHIANNKHINSKEKQVSWNDDGTRHDKKSFNDNFKGIEKAKSIARNVLGLSDEITLESIENYKNKDLILENLCDLSINTKIFLFYIVNSKTKRLLFG